MNSQRLPIVTPEKVLEKRGIKASPSDANMAIICFRGKLASAKSIARFCGSPLQEGILYHPKLYYSSEPDLLIVPEMVWGGPVTAIVVEELFTLGVRKLIGFGAGGSINPEIHPGAMFVAEKALCTDGTSREYSDQVDCGPDPHFSHYYLDRCEELGVLLLSGRSIDSDKRYSVKFPSSIFIQDRYGVGFNPPMFQNSKINKPSLLRCSFNPERTSTRSS